MQYKTILIVEDDDAIREALYLIIKSEGYKARVCNDGKEALHILQSLKQAKQPCLVLCDLMMPNLSGWELIELLNEDIALAVIPVVVLSANTTAPNNTKFLKKPVDIDILMDIVKEHCGSPDCE